MNLLNVNGWAVCHDFRHRISTSVISTLPERVEPNENEAEGHRIWRRKNNALVLAECGRWTDSCETHHRRYRIFGF